MNKHAKLHLEMYKQWKYFIKRVEYKNYAPWEMSGHSFF